MIRMWTIAGLVLALGCATTTTVPEEPRQDPRPEPPIAEPDDGGMPQEGDPEGGAVDPMEEAMKAWTAAGAVGEHHEHLAGLAGEWDAVTKAWHTPEGPPTESTGSATNTLILDGRFLKLEYEGVMDMGEGVELPFAGMGLLGYDNLENWHTSVWVDSMSTTILVLHGTCDEEGRRITLMGSYTDPVSGERKTMRFVYRIESEDRYVLELFMPDMDGKEYRGVEIVHTRK